MRFRYDFETITFMVLYSIIKPYNSFCVINRHIARQDFILNDLFTGEIPEMTSHKQKVAQKLMLLMLRSHVCLIRIENVSKSYRKRM
jgi:hypothetical protein